MFGRTLAIIMTDKELDLLVEIIGWIGSAAILLAYSLNSYQKIRSDSPAFLLLNLSGGIMLMAYSFYLQAFANTFLNLVWAIVALFALRKYLKQRSIKNQRS